MPRFNPNMSKETAGIPILPRDDYEFIIRDGRPFARQNQKGDDIWGIMYILEVATPGQFAGKSIPLSLYMHSENSGSLNKQFQMAALGYDVKDEDTFNEEYNDDEGYMIDTDEGLLGDYWKDIIGKRINASVAVVPQRDDPETKQNRFKWFPFS